jgi:hypothetical protein
VIDILIVFTSAPAADVTAGIAALAVGTLPLGFRDALPLLTRVLGVGKLVVNVVFIATTSTDTFHRVDIRLVISLVISTVAVLGDLLVAARGGARCHEAGPNGKTTEVNEDTDLGYVLKSMWCLDAARRHAIMKR